MPRVPPLSLALAPILLLSAASCGKNSSGARDAAGDLAAAICELAFGCCSRGEIDVLLGPYVSDGENCAQRVVNSASLAPSLVLDLDVFGGVRIVLPNLGNLQRALADGRTRVDAAALDACLSFIAGVGCGGAVEEEPAAGCVPPPLPEETPCDMDKLFQGRVGEGGACSSPGLTFECETGLVCRSGGGFGVEGACVRTGSVGAFCFTSQECHEDLYCSQLDGTCQVPRAEGETCLYADRDDPSPPPSTLLIACEQGLSCDPVTDTCVAACQRGAGCGGDAQCDLDEELVCVLGRCDLPRGLGLACGEDADCQEGLVCRPDPAQPSESVCSERLADNQICSFGGDAECQSGYCDQDTSRCAAQVEPGGLCPSGRDLQCAAGYCETEIILCSNDDPCQASGVCILALGRCEFACVADRAENAPCERDAHCRSGACVGGFCRSLPLADGQDCSSSLQCASGFCGLEAQFSCGVDLPPVCTSLPLGTGETCGSCGSLCATGICFNRTCSAGLREGERCDLAGQPPCGGDLYCDFQAQPSVCVPVLEAGEPCDGSFQCRGACVVAFGRSVCDATAADEAAICDGP